MIKKFREFVNEGVRDQMIPKSTEDIKNQLKGKPFNYIAHNLELQDLKIADFFTKQEIKDSLKDEPFVYINFNLETQGLDINDFFTKEEIDKMDRMSFSYIDVDQEVIFLDTKRMEKILSIVGEGINDVDVRSNQYHHNEYQNEVFVTYCENAWGDISLEEWNKLDKTLKKLINKNGLDDYDINTGSLILTLKFESKYPLEEL